MSESFQSRFLANLAAINAALGGAPITVPEPQSFESTALLMMQAIALAAAGAATTADWSGITGDLVDQAELTTALQSKQDADADLGAIAALTGSGFLQRTGANAWALAALATVALSGNYNDLTNRPDLSAFDEVLPYASTAAFPNPGTLGKVYVAEDTGLIYRWSGAAYVELSAGGGIWGQISGTLSSQTDLQNALNAKQAASAVLSAIAALTTGEGVLQRLSNGSWSLVWQALSAAPDVAIATPVDGHILRHNGTRWINVPLSDYSSSGPVESTTPPPSPSDGDRWLQISALGRPREEWYWDASVNQWLSAVESSISGGAASSTTPASNSSHLAHRTLEVTILPIALTAFCVPFHLNSACSGSDYHIASFYYQYFAGTAFVTSSAFFTANTANYASGNHAPKWVLPSPYIPPNNAYRLRMTPTAQGSPPTVNYSSAVFEAFYRRVYS